MEWIYCTIELPDFNKEVLAYNELTKEIGQYIRMKLKDGNWAWFKRLDDNTLSFGHRLEDVLRWKELLH